MKSNIIKIAGKTIKPGILKLKKAKDFFTAVGSSPFANILNIIKDEFENEIIIFETNVEIPQYPVANIKRTEIIAVSFTKNDNQIPKVYTLREDFPALPHQLQELKEFPRSLCLYDISYEEIKLSWTGYTFLERIREWLKLSALGILHQQDQPLEPLLSGDKGSILLDLPFSNTDINIYLRHIDTTNGNVYLIATTQEVTELNNRFPAQIEALTGSPQIHGIITAAPQNLFDLAVFLKKADIDLIGYLKRKLLEYKGSNKKLTDKLLLVIDLPKLRSASSHETNIDSYVFLTADSLEVIGNKLGLWATVDPKLGLGILLGESKDEDSLKTSIINVLRPVLPFNPVTAAYMNSTKPSETVSKLLAVGVGALGSQVLNNLVRAAVGIWKIIDSDFLLPHNLARHSLGGFHIMKPKVLGVANQANIMLHGSVTPIIADIIQDIDSIEVQNAIKDSELILDMSASSAAMRVLCDQKDRSRICSYFLNPSGDSFIAITEDVKLENKAIFLEGLYLRLILNTPELHQHFNQDNQTFRYAPGCRDVSVILPQDSIAQAAAIGSKYIKKLLSDNKASIIIWKTDPETLATKRFEAEIHKLYQTTIDEWTVVIDQYVLDKVNQLRNQKLPNETGGILIGNYDMHRKLIHVLEIIPSPSDSHEYPTAYIRGIKDIGNDLKRIKEITAGGIKYIGEWHTHPKGCGSGMSGDDEILFSWLNENMKKEGLPALMFIVGEDSAFYLCS